GGGDAAALAGGGAGAGALGSADVGAGGSALGGTGVFTLSPAWHLFASCVVVPAVAFVAVSVFRRAFNAPRPYEVLAIEPLISKDTRGKSFPSRHTFSMFTIACAWWQLEPVVGAVLGVAGAAMGAVRVLGGVHFPRDVVAGALSAVVLSAAGYALLALV
ncbi:MAG: phosphatase PAP2 family protein, partial [Eggerthellaceae bacterium]|nr:phosphatase PAP2 family protein [Eggerthellaceae bacterium]